MGNRYLSIRRRSARFKNRANFQAAFLLALLPIAHGAAIQHVSEAAVQPGFPGFVIMLAVNEFIEHVRVVAAQTEQLLLQTFASMCHEIFIALIT